jgi:hypothetical protein
MVLVDAGIDDSDFDAGAGVGDAAGDRAPRAGDID